MLATLGILLLAQRGGVSDPRRSYAGGDKDAILMLPPVTVCDSDVQEMVWTADGSSLVVRRVVNGMTPADATARSMGKPPSPADEDRLRPKLELLVWSARSHKGRVAVSGDVQSLTITSMDPLAGSDRVIFGADEKVTGPDGQTKDVISYTMLATGTGNLTRLCAFDPTQTSVGLGLSSSRPLGYLTAIDATTKSRTIRFFGPDGHLGNPIAAPTSSHVDFDESGLPTLFVGAERKGKAAIFHFQKIDLAAARLGDPYDRSSIPDATPPKSVLQTTSVSGTADGARAPTILLKVAGGKPTEAGVVTTDGVSGLMSPKGDAVAYVGQGSAVVRPLARISRREYDAAMIAAAKAVAMSNAKQVALGLIMFAADMDDTLPSQGDYRKVAPYLKDSSLMDSFSYTFGGGNLTTIENPASTAIGYVSGPGGRAVAYADGHVVWVPDGP